MSAALGGLVTSDYNSCVEKIGKSQFYGMWAQHKTINEFMWSTAGLRAAFVCLWRHKQSPSTSGSFCDCN